MLQKQPLVIDNRMNSEFGDSVFAQDDNSKIVAYRTLSREKKQKLTLQKHYTSLKLKKELLKAGNKQAWAFQSEENRFLHCFQAARAILES